MSPAPKSGMVLAAGLGLRMRPITERLPKPLIPLGGRTLLDHAIDRLEAAGCSRIVVNAHYLADQVEAHLARRTAPAITLSREDELLETGGGVLKALPLLDDVFYVVNSDIFWLDGMVPALTRLARAFTPEHHDAVLLLQRTVTALGYDGPGDFIVDDKGRLRRRREREIAPHLFAGVQLLSKRLFAGASPGKFSLNPLYDKAIAADRLVAIVHDGEWYHIGTPAGLARAEARLATHRTER
ncbi:MAG TPA: nucleotidyltransferase family protein [Stellaceae bacterium]|nr:nucleotidyltransferase family protein [Stellaceae bacterium]